MENPNLHFNGDALDAHQGYQQSWAFGGEGGGVHISGDISAQCRATTWAYYLTCDEVPSQHWLTSHIKGQVGKEHPCPTTGTFTQSSYRPACGLNSPSPAVPSLGPSQDKDLHSHSTAIYWEAGAEQNRHAPQNTSFLFLWSYLISWWQKYCLSNQQPWLEHPKGCFWGKWVIDALMVKCSILVTHRPPNLWSKPRAHSPNETSPKTREGTLKWKVGPMTQPLWGQRQAEEALV